MIRQTYYQHTNQALILYYVIANDNRQSKILMMQATGQNFQIKRNSKERFLPSLWTFWQLNST